MPAGGILAFGRAPRLVEDDLLAVAHGFADGLCEPQPVKILEAFRIDGDDVRLVRADEVAHHVPEREISLVAH